MREAAAFERTAKLIEQREADVKKAVDENRALLAAAETEKNRAERAQRAAEQRRDAAIKQAKSIADSSVRRAEGEVAPKKRASGTATKIDPTAAAVAGGLCGLLLCNAVGLAQLDCWGRARARRRCSRRWTPWVLRRRRRSRLSRFYAVASTRRLLETGFSPRWRPVAENRG